MQCHECNIIFTEPKESEAKTKEEKVEKAKMEMRQMMKVMQVRFYHFTLYDLKY